MTTTIPTPTPSLFHFPCWELTTNAGEGAREARYLVWAPGDITHQGHPTGKVRECWASNWADAFGGRGGHTSGDTMDYVLGLFPPDVADAFRPVITAWQAGIA